VEVSRTPPQLERITRVNDVKIVTHPGVVLWALMILTAFLSEVDDFQTAVLV